MIRSPLTAEERLRNRVETLEDTLLVVRKALHHCECRLNGIANSAYADLVDVGKRVEELELTARAANAVEISHGMTLEEHSNQLSEHDNDIMRLFLITKGL